MKLFFSLIVFLFISFQAFGVEIKVANIVSDIDTEQTDFFLVLKDDASIDSVRFITKNSNGRVTEDYTYPVETVQQDGIILYARNGYNVVLLKVDSKFNPISGGVIILDYLYNGVTGTRRSLRMKVTKLAQSFILTTMVDAPANKFLVLGNRHPILGLIGVKDIVSSFKP